MSAKITLITPPDIFENDQPSVLFIDLTTKEQDEVTKWFLDTDDIKLNVYYYQGEYNISWLLYALSVANFRYVNLSNMSAITSYLAGYIVSRSNVFYKVEDQNVAELYSHLNYNRVNNVVEFLDKVFSGTK